MNVKVTQVKTIKEGIRNLQTLIKSYKWSQVDPILFCVQSTKPDAVLRKEFPSLTQYPIVRISATDSPAVLSGLSWWTNISKLVIVHYLNSYTILSVSLYF